MAPKDNEFLNINLPFFRWEPSTTEPVTTADVFEYLLRVTTGDIDTGPFAIEVNLLHPTIEFQVTGDLADDTYRWRVIARDRALNTASSETRTFTVDTTPPGVPAPRAPPEDSLLNPTSLPPAFSWVRSKGEVVDYLLRVTSVDFDTGPFVIDVVVRDPRALFQATADLADDTYRWRVTARDRVLNTAESVTRTFTVDTVPPTPPTELTPADGAFLNTRIVPFKWEASTGDVSSYLLKVVAKGDDLDLGPFVVKQRLAATKFPSFTGDLAPNVTYRWQVIARDEALNRALSVINTLTIDTVAPAPPARLVSPADNAFLNTRTLPPFFDWDPSTSDDVFSYVLRVTSGDIDTGPFVIEVVTAHPTTQFQATADLADDIYRWRVVARDRALNTAFSGDRSFTVDTTLPTKPGTPTDETIDRNDLVRVFTWQRSTDPGFNALDDPANTGSGVDLYSVEITGPQEIADTVTPIGCNLGPEGDRCQFVTPELVPGNYEIVVNAVDRAANQSLLPATADFRAGAMDIVQNLRVIGKVFENTFNTQSPTFRWTRPDELPDTGDLAGGIATYEVTIIGFIEPGAYTRAEFFSFKCFNASGEPILTTADDCAKGVGAGDEIQITVEEDVPDGTHTLEVRVVPKGGVGGDPVSLTFTVDITPPGAPALVSPTDGAFINTRTPLLDWAIPTGDVFDYLLQVTSGDITAGPYDVEVLVAHPNTKFLITGDLEEVEYKWRVIAGDRALNTFSSVTRTFTVDVTPPGAPDLVSPDNDALLNTNTPTLEWSAADDAVDYLLRVTSGDIDTGPFDIDVMITGDITQFQVAAGDKVGDGTYTWRVIARDRALNTASTGDRSFTVDTTAPGAAELVSPPDIPEQGSFLNTNKPKLDWNSSTGDVFDYKLQVVRSGDDFTTGPFAITGDIPTGSLDRVELVELVTGDRLTVLFKLSQDPVYRDGDAILTDADVAVEYLGDVLVPGPTGDHIVDHIANTVTFITAPITGDALNLNDLSFSYSREVVQISTADVVVLATADGVTSLFTLSQDPVDHDGDGELTDADVEVEHLVGTVLVPGPTGDYIVDHTANTVTFTSAPITGDAVTADGIRFTYTEEVVGVATADFVDVATADDLIAIFALAQDPINRDGNAVLNDLDVAVEHPIGTVLVPGIGPTGDYTVDHATNTVTFTTAPIIGDAITPNLKLSYNVGSPPLITGDTTEFQATRDLADDFYQWRVVARDKARNTASSVSRTFLVDTVPPTTPVGLADVTIDPETGELDEDDVVRILEWKRSKDPSFIAPDNPANTGSGVDFYKVEITGAQEVITTVDDSDTAICSGDVCRFTTPELVPGNYDITVIAVDVATNQSVAAAATFRAGPLLVVQNLQVTGDHVQPVFVDPVLGGAVNTGNPQFRWSPPPNEALRDLGVVGISYEVAITGGAPLTPFTDTGSFIAECFNGSGEPIGAGETCTTQFVTGDEIQITVKTDVPDGTHRLRVLVVATGHVVELATADDLTTVFNLAQDPLDRDADGVLTDEDALVEHPIGTKRVTGDYTVDHAANTVTFTTAPITGGTVTADGIRFSYHVVVVGGEVTLPYTVDRTPPVVSTPVKTVSDDVDVPVFTFPSFDEHTGVVVFHRIHIESERLIDITVPAPPTLTSPAEDVFTGDVRTFTWNQVKDDISAVTYTLEIDLATGDFDGQVFRKSSLPDEPITGDIIQFVLPAALASGDFVWRAGAVDRSGNIGDFSKPGKFSIGIDDVRPGPPTPLSPIDGSTIDNPRPEFAWSRAIDFAGENQQVSGVRSYTLEISTADITKPFFTKTGILEETGFTLSTGDLKAISTSDALPNGDYIWQVRAVDRAGNEGPFSDPVTFTLVDDARPPEVPTLITPRNGSTGSNTTPTFTWTRVINDIKGQVDKSGVSFYILEIDIATGDPLTGDFIDLAFGPVTVPETGDGDRIKFTLSTADALATGDDYIWRVVAVDGAGNTGDFSDPFTFTVVAGAPVPSPVPVLISPASGDRTEDTTRIFSWSPVTGDLGDVTYTLEIATGDQPPTGDFNNPVFRNLSIPDELVTSDLIRFTLSTADALVTGDYIWHVRTVDGAGNSGDFSDPFTFTVVAGAPVPSPVPILISPASGDRTEDATPTFSWSPVTGDLGDVTYTLEIDFATGDPLTGDFIDLVFGPATADQVVAGDRIQFTLSTGDALTTWDYIWRVRADTGDFSVPFTFTLLPPPALSSVLPPVTLTSFLTPVLISPATGDTIEDSTPTFTWSQVTGDLSPVTYTLEVDFATLDFSNPRKTEDVADLVAATDNLQFTVTFLPSGNFKWRVLAKDEAGNTGDSGPFFFTIDLPPDTTPPARPTLISPRDGSTGSNNTPTFTWTRVTDPRGVSYTLEIATADRPVTGDQAVTGDFSTLVFQKVNIGNKPFAGNRIQFGLSSGDALATGDYIWRVVAVDGAGNTSDFNDTFTFTPSGWRSRAVPGTRSHISCRWFQRRQRYPHVHLEPGDGRPQSCDLHPGDRDGRHSHTPLHRGHT